MTYRRYKPIQLRENYNEGHNHQSTLADQYKEIIQAASSTNVSNPKILMGQERWAKQHSQWLVRLSPSTEKQRDRP